MIYLAWSVNGFFLVFGIFGIGFWYWISLAFDLCLAWVRVSDCVIEWLRDRDKVTVTVGDFVIEWVIEWLEDWESKFISNFCHLVNF